MDGLYLELKAYQHHAFIDFKEILDEDNRWQAVCSDLNGNGYWSVQARYDELNKPSLIVESEKPTLNQKRKINPGVKIKPEGIKKKNPPKKPA